MIYTTEKREQPLEAWLHKHSCLRALEAQKAVLVKLKPKEDLLSFYTHEWTVAWSWPVGKLVGAPLSKLWSTCAIPLQVSFFCTLHRFTVHSSSNEIPPARNSFFCQCLKASSETKTVASEPHHCHILLYVAWSLKRSGQCAHTLIYGRYFINVQFYSSPC